MKDLATTGYNMLSKCRNVLKKHPVSRANNGHTLNVVIDRWSTIHVIIRSANIFFSEKVLL